MAKDPDPDQTSDLSQIGERTDQEAVARVKMLRRILDEKGDSMDADTKSQFLTDLLSAEGQVKSATQRAEAERRMGGGTKPER